MEDRSGDHLCMWLFFSEERKDEAWEELCRPENVMRLGLHWFGMFVPDRVRAEMDIRFGGQ